MLISVFMDIIMHQNCIDYLTARLKHSMRLNALGVADIDVVGGEGYPSRVTPTAAAT